MHMIAITISLCSSHATGMLHIIMPYGKWHPLLSNHSYKRVSIAHGLRLTSRSKILIHQFLHHLRLLAGLC